MKAILDCATAGSGVSTTGSATGGWPSVPAGLITFGLVDLAVVIWAGMVAATVILVLLKLSDRRARSLQLG
jgi:hypothetical protein